MKELNMVLSNSSFANLAFNFFGTVKNITLAFFPIGQVAFTKLTNPKLYIYFEKNIYLAVHM